MLWSSVHAKEVLGKMFRNVKTQRGSHSIRLLLSGLLPLAALIFFTRTGWAQTPQPPTDDQVNAIARELYCPVCENVTLDVCPTQACAQWRDLIRLKLLEGWSPEEIRDFFAEQYGDGVLSSPKLRGFNLVFYVLLAVFLTAAIVIFLRVMSELKTSPKPTEGLESPHSDKYLDQIEEELKHREKGG
jgi:cytochrome c-type biogenesis protein CcmH